MVINITCLKIPGSGFISAAFEYPSMTNKEIIQYTNIVYYLPKPLSVYVLMLLLSIVGLYS